MDGRFPGSKEGDRLPCPYPDFKTQHPGQLCLWTICQGTWRLELLRRWSRLASGAAPSAGTGFLPWTSSPALVGPHLL